MGGGLLQLVTKGEHDTYLTGNPEVSFFKMIYKRHTNFAMETIEILSKEQPQRGRQFTFTIPKTGDLIKKCWINITLPAITTSVPNGLFRWTEKPGHAFIDYVEIEIGGQRIDRHYADYFEIFNEFYIESDAKYSAYRYMIGDVSYMTDYSNSKESFRIHVPLLFWFMNDGMELPLVALQNHEVKFNIKLRDYKDIIQVLNMTKSQLSLNQDDIDVSLWVDYIYLDSKERRSFAESDHKYLITQLQYNGDVEYKGKFAKVPIYFNHPVRELFWFLQPDTYIQNNKYFKFDYDYDDFNTKSLVNKCRLILNGLDFTNDFPWEFWNIKIPYDKYQRVPRLGMNAYAFCLNPKIIQPSGTLNMSRVENATLQIETIPEFTDNYKVKVYAINYNIFNVKAGMGFIEFA